MKRIFFIGGIVLLLAILIEVSLRVALGLGSPPLVQADDQIGYLFKPGQDVQRFGNRIAINEYHQRSDELSSDGQSVRIMFVGDSVTWGSVLLDQRETYPELFRALMQATCDRPVEALNASAGSWGMGNRQAYMERFGTFESDIVVLQIGSHDLLQSTSTSDVVGRDHGFPDEAPTLAMQELLVRYAWPRIRNVLGILSLPVYADGNGMVAPFSNSDFSRNMDKLSEMVALIREADGQPVVLSTSDRNEVVRENSTFADTYEVYRSAFLTRTDSLDVPVINMLSKWQGHSETPTFFRDEVHLTAEGNEAIAAALYDTLWDLSLASACRE